MATIDVVASSENSYEVSVRDRGSSTFHEVTVSAREQSDLAPRVAPELLVFSSFEFLLEREPKESILARFPISVIATYFPEYPGGISERCMTAAERWAASVFAKEGMEPYSWSNEARFSYPSHEHAYGKVLFCVAGSITFELADGQSQLIPGNRLDIAAGSSHSAVVGASGVTCLEGRR